jgi:micrococcal nuclease
VTSPRSYALLAKCLGISSCLLGAVFLILSVCSADQFKVARVTDGDTIRARGASGETIIRLVGIDAPETSHKKHEPGQPFSQQSKKYLAELVLNEKVDIQSFGQDRYGRLLGMVSVDGKNVYLEMVRAGLAEVYRGEHAKGFDPGPYMEAEKRAREGKRGMWVQGEKYVSPREWRMER